VLCQSLKSFANHLRALPITQELCQSLSITQELCRSLDRFADHLSALPITQELC
jgi:hypothetical protein